MEVKFDANKLGKVVLTVVDHGMHTSSRKDGHLHYFQSLMNNRCTVFLNHVRIDSSIWVGGNDNSKVVRTRVKMGWQHRTRTKIGNRQRHATTCDCLEESVSPYLMFAKGEGAV